MALIKKPVSVKEAYGERVSTGEVEIQSWDSGERYSRAVKYAAMCFGFAVFSILLPIVHFFAVPGFLLLTPVVFWWFNRQTEAVVGGRADCPCCGKNFGLARGGATFPMNDLCEHCKRPVKVELT